MSEGYICDRCGSTHGGGPDTMLILGDGRNRTRRSLTRGEWDEYSPSEMVGDSEFDLCQSCRNDLRAWWANGGGDVTDISRTSANDTEGDA